VFWPSNGSLLPFSGETNAWFQAHRGNRGSKLPVWGSIRLLKAAPGLRLQRRVRRNESKTMVHCAGHPRSIEGEEFDPPGIGQ
jgi:hypothetical protein